MTAMSTVVLARKYRPRRFDQMVGQPHVVQALGNALAHKRLHHAYLFTGTRGIGKTTVSRILAKSLNCIGVDGRGDITAEPCGVCEVCTAIDADRYVDYIELDAASNRSIDEVRELIERAAYKPSVGRFKVFMIDEAHQLTKDAFNALLKTLEEPPDYLKFVLATTDPDKMLPTVLSRCLQFNLRPMAPEVVQEHLARVLQAEGVEVEPAALRLLGRAARGSMRDALSLTDQAIAYGGGRIGEAVVRGMLGSVDASHAATLVDAVVRRDGAALLAAVDALRMAGASALATLEAIAELLQAAAVEQVVPGATDDGDPEASTVRALAARLPADELQLLYSIALHGRAELPLASDEHGGLTMVLLRPFAFPAAGAPAAPAPAARAPRPAALRAPAVAAATVALPEPTPTPVIDRVAPERAAGTVGRRTAEQTPEPEPASAVAVDPSAQAPAGDADASPRPASSDGDASGPTELGRRWAQLVRRLIDGGHVSALTRELAWQSGLLEIDGADAPSPRWRLGVERETLRAPLLADRLAAALSELLGAPQTIRLEPAAPADTPARRDAAARERRQREAQQTIESDPVVRALLSQFHGARIVPGSVKPLQFDPRKDTTP